MPSLKDVLVVKGRNSPTSDFDILEVTNVVPRAEIEYPADLAEFAGSLGECSNGVSPTDPTDNSTIDESSGGGGGALGLATAGVLTSIAAKRLVKRVNLEKPDIEKDN